MSELERRLEDLGRGILEADRPISLLELELAPHDAVSGPKIEIDEDDVVTLRPTIRSRRRWQIFLAASVVTFLAFLPFLLAQSPDEDKANSTSPLTTPAPEEETPWSLERLGLSETFPSSGGWVRLDGVYYGQSRPGVWLISVDGLDWAPISPADSNALPRLGGSDVVAFHQSGTEIYATVLNTSERSLRVLEWVGGDWVEVPVSHPTPPEGVSFIPQSNVGHPTMVVLRDGFPVTVARHVGSGRTVTAGGVIYGIAEKDPEKSGDDTEFMLWRSDDGVEWSTVDMPGPARGELDWAYLTAGHDRLMLTIGVPDGVTTNQLILTSTDGAQWDEVEVELPASNVPSVPEATDFGWMVQALTGPEPGMFQYSGINLQVSPNGIDWEQKGGSWASGLGARFEPRSYPVVYAAGLFARGEAGGGSGTKVWRIVDEKADTTVTSVTTPATEEETLWSLEKPGLSETFPTASGGEVTGRWVRLDGAYYGRTRGGPWVTSVDGLIWTRISPAGSNAVPQVSPSEAVAFHQSGTETYATTLDNEGGILRVLKWVDGEWVEMPVTYPTPPEDVTFIPAMYIGRPTMAVLQDGLPVTVGRPLGSGGTVTAGGVIFGIALKDPERVREPGEDPEYVLWRSDDGVEWSTVDMPDPARGELDWAYLTAGHDRLMLTIGVPDGVTTNQLILTSTDGENWDEVELPAFNVPAVPEATDFGWMIQSLTGPGGWFSFSEINLYVSPNGIDWEEEGGRWGAGVGTKIMPVRFPVAYEAGLFARQSSFGAGVLVWRIADE